MKFKILLFLLCSVLSYSTFAQECGTVPTEEQLAFMNKNIRDKSATRWANDWVKIPVKLHVVRQDNGTGGLTESELLSAIQTVNSFYKNANIELVPIAEINYIDNSKFYDYNTADEGKLAVGNDVNRVINVYFLNSIVSSGGSSLCGYTFFPPSADRIFMANGCTTSGNTFAHEFGHYFTLYHTHGKTNTGTTDEYVNGSNCTTAGDNLCDTPADPNLSGKVTNCAYAGSDRDANGDPYSPQVSNIMSYAPGNCRKNFTPQQYARIREGFDKGRYYLNYQVEGFQARFVSSATEVCIGSSVEFSSQSAGAKSYKWEFEGGTPSTSTSVEPTITYPSSGTFNVKLTVSDGSGNSDQIIRNDWINVIDPLENAFTSAFQDPLNDQQFEFWTRYNPDQSRTFIHTEESPSGGVDDYSVLMENYRYDANYFPQEDGLISNFFDTRGASSFTISFDYAYTYQSTLGLNKADTLKIGYKVGCSNEFKFMWAKGGAELSTRAPLNEYFTPTEGDWNNKTVTIPRTADMTEGVQFVLMNVSGNGNNLYLDNILIEPNYQVNPPEALKISQYTTSPAEVTLRWSDKSANESQFVVERAKGDGDFVEYAVVEANKTFYKDLNIAFGYQYRYRVYAVGREGFRSPASNEVVTEEFITSIGKEEFLDNISLYPNPFENEVNLKIEGEKFGQVEVLISNIMGQQVGYISLEKLEPTLYEKLPVANDLMAGMYFVRLRFDGNQREFVLIKN